MLAAMAAQTMSLDFILLLPVGPWPFFSLWDLEGEADAAIAQARSLSSFD
jgi:hypothetical protein